jgi:hypothetical protein
MTETDSWLPLAEYSMKHQVSISTLRRRIKAEDIHFRFDDGKYYILDDASNFDHNRPSLTSEEIKQLSEHSSQNARVASNTQASLEAGESVLTSANRLLTDLKKAYTQVLQDKENQIQELKQELADIKTLVKVLEFENEKLRNYVR